MLVRKSFSILLIVRTDMFDDSDFLGIIFLAVVGMGSVGLGAGMVESSYQTLVGKSRSDITKELKLCELNLPRTQVCTAKVVISPQTKE